ncbi:MAG TPA: hypothetical protein VL443_24515 [Cyclobacteriaceae bacterium]|jgi:hypothetical protein|nr:hypothetical protein [Cyclobacteriaceae bacterium]
MKTGIELIAEERSEQISKHGYSIEDDIRKYPDSDLIRAACAIAFIAKDGMPCQLPAPDWAWSIRERIEKDRIHCLKVAGAFIAAEIDRIQYKSATTILFENGIDIGTLNDEFNSALLKAMEEYKNSKP